MPTANLHPMMTNPPNKPGNSLPFGSKKEPVITAKEFEEIFGRVGDFSTYVDKASAQPPAAPKPPVQPEPPQPAMELRRVTIDFPEWVIESLEAESRLIGVSKQAIVKMWIAERLQQRQGKDRI